MNASLQTRMIQSHRWAHPATAGTIIYDNELGRSDADDPITSVGAGNSVNIKK
jgi:hypothetical protein